MSNIYDDEILEFPSNLTCVITNGFKSKLIRKKRYLGGASAPIDAPRVSATIITTSLIELADFADWWVAELDYGYKAFTIELPFFGINRAWEVKLKNDLEEILKTTTVREITLELELTEDISTIFGLANMCWNNLTSTGTVFSSPVIPTHTADGTLVYNMQFDISDGVFISQFGELGNEQLDNISIIMFSYTETKYVALQWDDVNLYYTGTNLTLANEIALRENTRVCFLATVTPDLLIHYDYITIEED